MKSNTFSLSYNNNINSRMKTECIILLYKIISFVMVCCIMQKKRRIISKENSAQAKGKLSYLLSRKSIFSPRVLFNMLDTETNNYTKKLLCMSVLNIIILAPTFSAY